MWNDNGYKHPAGCQSTRQLFEYRYRKQVATARLVIVLGSRPKACEVDFVKSLGLELTYYDTETDAFISV